MCLLFVFSGYRRNINGSMWQNIFSHLPHTHGRLTCARPQPRRIEERRKNIKFVLDSLVSHISSLKTFIYSKQFLFGWAMNWMQCVCACGSHRIERKNRLIILHTHFVRTYHFRPTVWLLLDNFFDHQTFLFIALSVCAWARQPRWRWRRRIHNR